MVDIGAGQFDRQKIEEEEKAEQGSNSAQAKG